MRPRFLPCSGSDSRTSAEPSRLVAAHETPPARLLVLEFATKLAAERAAPQDVARIRDITDLLIAAFDRGDPVVIAHGFQRWLDALIEAGHSVAVRWIANPFLDAYRELLDR